MWTKGLDRIQVSQIVDTVSRAQFGGNLTFQREPEAYRGGVRFTLRVRSSKRPGHRIGFWRTKRGNDRRLIAACFHAYGEVIRSLLEAGASRLETAPSVAERRKGGPGSLRWTREAFGECAERVGARNVGSMIEPRRFDEMCHCGVPGMPAPGHDYDRLPAKVERGHRLGAQLMTATVTMMPQAMIRRCKFSIFKPEHYRADGSCKCDSAAHRAMMIAEWEYSEADFDGPAARP